MKKFISYALAAALAFPAVSTFDTWGKTYVSAASEDAQTTVDENAEALAALLEEAEITNDTTVEDFDRLVYASYEYGCGLVYEISDYKFTKATASKEGSLTAVVTIMLDDASCVLDVNLPIPKLEYDPEAEEEEESEEIEEKEEKAEIVPKKKAEEKIDAKSELQKAGTAIHDAMWEFNASNDTTKRDILNMAQDALPKGSHVSIDIKDEDFSLLKSTSTVNGTLSVTLTLTCGSHTKRVAVAKSIAEVVSSASKKIDEDRRAVNTAVDKVPLTNRITKEEILNAILPAVKNGTKVTWKSYSMQKATFSEPGKITASLQFVLDGEERKTELQLTIPKLVRKVPTDKLSLNADEWDVLRLTNTARIAAGAPAVSMIETLQRATDIRETEISELFSHTRPDGSLCFSALPADYPYSGAAENIARGFGSTTDAYSAEDAVNGWINSPGHYANMIDPKFAYVGMGFLPLNDQVLGVQMFTGGSTIVKTETSAGTMHFDNTDDLQAEYLICTAADGTVSYLPLDIEQMEPTEGGYRLVMHSSGPIIFTIGDGSAPSTSSAFSDVLANAYYADAVKWAVENNVTAGTSATTFSPDDTCTRAQILSFMWRASGSPEPTVANPFDDVKITDYYCKPAVWAYEKGMISGAKFEAETPCRRSDTMKYFWLYAGSPSAPASAFVDVSSQEDYFDAVNWAVANGITSGTSETDFSPNVICSRAQIVSFLFRAIDFLK